MKNNNRFIVFAAISLALVLSGCATPTKMAFEKDTEVWTEKSKPVYLMTATIKNNYHTAYQPRLRVVHVEKTGAKGAADKLNFTMDDKAKNLETDSAATGSNYLLRLQMDPGSYDVIGMTCTSASFPIIGFFMLPVHEHLDVNGSGIYYLGHINATVRERKGDEFKAGPSIPLIDQAVAGASGGTWDVEVTDGFATDEALFRSQFPALKDANIQKQILPAFDRAEAQKWWEAH